MTKQAVLDAFKEARSALMSIRFIPGLSDADDAEALRLITETDRLTSFSRSRQGTPTANKAWLRGLRSLLAEGRGIQRKYGGLHLCGAPRASEPGEPWAQGLVGTYA